MISDVISDALDEIEQYENDPVFALAYADPQIQAKLAEAKRAMRDLLALLDAPPKRGGP